ncbi:MAG: hypothetical protein GDA46_06430 [Bdellovibrionales bacterium]|nr:hypothetical protein [Bdellovibrionales bacterium]
MAPDRNFENPLFLKKNNSLSLREDLNNISRDKSKIQAFLKEKKTGEEESNFKERDISFGNVVLSISKRQKEDLPTLSEDQRKEGFSIKRDVAKQRKKK